MQVITTPFFPGYLTPERIAKAKNLKLALTAGIGSDHVDLEAASKAEITVAEVTGQQSAQYINRTADSTLCTDNRAAADEHNAAAGRVMITCTQIKT